MKTEEVRPRETLQLGLDLPTGCSGCTTGCGGNVTRRGFMGTMGAMMASAALAAAARKTALADEVAGDAEADVVADVEDEDAAEEEATVSTLTGWTGTPEDILALGVSTMPLDDLNEYRQKYLDAQTDYVKEDGTVVPACYVKVRALIHTYGMGCGNTPMDTSFDDVMEVFSEDDAQAYIDMPMGVEFDAYDMCAKTGRSVDECTEICERLAQAGYLIAYDGNKGRCYHHIPFFQGVIEYHFEDRAQIGGENATVTYGLDQNIDMANTGTPTFYYVPVDASVTSDGTILPYDDLKEKVKSRNTIALVPCYCRYSTLAQTYGRENIPSFEDFATGEYEDYFSDICNQRVETCIQTGNEAQYWLERGWGRQITGEEAAAYIERSVKDGFMLETTFGKDSEAICSCHIDSCGILQFWTWIGDADAIAGCDAFKQVSHYTLEVDPDKCIACGLCVDRCPLHIIEINDEGWAEPGVNCMRCGQCAYICPQGARKLVQRDESELAPLPKDMLEDSNVKAAYRFEKGLIY